MQRKLTDRRSARPTGLPKMAVLFLSCFLLTGCYLVSGQDVQVTPIGTEGEGAYTFQFVSSDGGTQRDLDIGLPNVPVLVEASVKAEVGELSLEFLGKDLVTLMRVTASYGLPGQGTVILNTDEEGRIRYRLISTETRNGSYTIRYQVQEFPPTPTPEPTP